MNPVKLEARNPTVFEAYQLTEDAKPQIVKWLEANGYMVWPYWEPNDLAYASTTRSEELRKAAYGQWIVLDTKMGIADTYDNLDNYKEADNG